MLAFHLQQEGSFRTAGISAPMDKGLHFTICVVTTVLLLRESSQAGEENDPEVLAAPKSAFVLLQNVNSLSFYLPVLAGFYLNLRIRFQMG